MPTIGNIPLISENPGSNPGGAAFLLSSRATKDVDYVLEHGEIEIRAGGAYLVVRCHEATDPSSAFSSGHALGQQGLDMLSILGLYDGAIREAEDEHLIWWTVKGGLFLRSVSTSLLKFTTGPVTLLVKDKDGNVIPPTIPTPRHYIAFRYFRLAQTTDDLFDAFRNMYLAFEALLSSQYPKPRQEKEIDWLHRALGLAPSSLRLDTLGLPQGISSVQAVIDAVYRDKLLRA